ncbi:TonB-dependent receptor plug domain-containing protein [Niabella sp.]|uniref:TonB-dependent receptor plug domain-containing protein n=1 Tax=Niabella sp. TaxID=1962976 RepID=UPI002606815D|nr:TonB-dependent receptor plug domain-containing protein [Niabella sp.]
MRLRIIRWMCVLFSGLLLSGQAWSQGDPEAEDSLVKVINTRRFNQALEQTHHPGTLGANPKISRMPLAGAYATPMVSLQQYVKGTAAGLFVKEENGEPGTEQFMFVRGLTHPVFSKQDLYSMQPAVFVNGAPLAQEIGLSYNIQRFDFNRIGPATNPLSILDVNNIAHVELLKSPADLARLGPLATNGALWVTTKNAQSGIRQFNVDTYVGLLQRPATKTVNAAYENDFRWPFYEKYASDDQKLDYPVYVANSYDPDYYGAANWKDLYYQSKPVYYLGFGLVGGSDRANFRFNISDTRSHNFDATGLDRYAVSFGINMLPLKWLTITSNMNAIRTQRERNRNLRDRFAETRFVPDLTNPVSPGATSYQRFLDKYRGSEDQNKTNSFVGYFSALAQLGQLSLKSQLSLDYEEGLRDVFYGKPLMDNTSFISSYFGFNQRATIQNTIDYHFKSDDDRHQVTIGAGQTFLTDQSKYDYVLGYNTPNDFIKIKEIRLGGSIYQNAYDIFAYPFTDKIKSALSSLYATLGYSFRNVITVNALGRYDGYSGFSKTNRWLLTPVFSSRFNIQELLQKNGPLSTLALKASWGVFGKLITDNRFRIGPQYRVDVGYSDEPVLGSYAGLAALSQTYSAGWMVNTYGWPYSEKLNIGTELGIWKDRILLGVDYYNNEDKNMIVPVSLPTESGFTYKQVQGMAVRNTGINVSITADILKHQKGLNWVLDANFSTNHNKLTRLPYQLQEIEYPDRKLVIGKPVDAFWVYLNEGIINKPGDIPMGPVLQDGSRNPLKFGTLELGVGDAIWKDVNNDGMINARDKVLKGHSMPVYYGGLGNTLTYRNFNMDFLLFYGLGHQLLNQLTSSKLDFINTENSRNITYVKEVTFWQQTFDYSRYPMYNPWSGTIPYQSDQDLFLERADFLKLRYVTLGYDFSKTGLLKGMKLSKALLYVTASNLFTITPFKGGDPELTDYQGIYSGRSLPIARSYIIGAKLNF